MNVHAERCATFRRSASRKPPPKDKSVRRLLRALAVHVEPFRPLDWSIAVAARLQEIGAKGEGKRSARRREGGAVH
jgi:hypothetical protein